MKLLELNRIRKMNVLQATFNPRGPGAVRIQLVPPEVSLFEEIAPGLIFINGDKIIPIRKSHTILFANFMEELAKYDGKVLNQTDVDIIIRRTVTRTKKVYYKTSKQVLIEDLYALIRDFSNFAYGREEASFQYPVVTLGEYAKYMRGPHRMDMMISPMTDECGKWYCPNKCLHCYAAGQKHAGGKQLTTEEWKKAIDKMKEAHVTQITFTGGEPLMRQDLPELVKYARYFISRVNTNGVLLTQEYAEKLIDAELDSIQITLYSADEAIHNQLVGANTYQKTVEGIKNAINAGLSVSINTPLCRLNKDYANTLKFLHELGIIYTSCSSIITTGNALKSEAEDTQLTEAELISILDEATFYAELAEMEMAFTSPGWVNGEKLKELNLTVPTCGACLSNMAITPIGDVVPCQSWLSGVTLGNILMDKWNTIWNGKECAEIRKNSCKMDGICPLRKEAK